MISASARVVKNDCARIAGRLETTVNEIMDDAPERVSRASVPFTPVDTGELVGSRRVERNGSMRRLVWLAGHAGFVHNGTIHMSPNPFGRRAYDQEAPAIVRDLSNLEGRLV